MSSPGQKAAKYFHASKGQLGMAFMKGPRSFTSGWCSFPPLKVGMKAIQRSQSMSISSIIILDSRGATFHKLSRFSVSSCKNSKSRYKTDADEAPV